MEDLSSIIIKAAYNVHNALGRGFLEKVYQNAMKIELEILGVKVESESPINAYYKGKRVGEYYADLLVEDEIIVELKAVET